MLHVVCVCVCVRVRACSLRHPACNEHAQYFHLQSVLLYSIFPHNLIKGTIVEKNVITPKRPVLIFSMNLSEKILILRRFERDVIINLHWPLCKVSFNFIRY
jgi:hypothetical protein